MISQQTIEEVKERANILELFSEITTVKRVGIRNMAICPFHGEKTPSLSIRDQENTYHCFGCGVSGNVISLVMQHRGLSFPDAVEELASRYGIEIKREGAVSVKKGESGAKAKLIRVNRAAWEFFNAALRQSEQATRYVAEREISDEMIARFGIGFAPAHRGSLTAFLQKMGVGDELLAQSGMVKRSVRGELYDVFGGRLMFPVFTDPKRIAGFGGRLIPELFDEESRNRYPKYLNSPETPLYQKSKILYGLPQALASIRKAGEVYLVEGYLDVISLSQRGVENVVATCGTALTEHHIRHLSQICKKVTVLFDGDKAGRAAAFKASKLFLNASIDVWVVFLSDGEDPDSFARMHREGTKEILASLPKHQVIDVFINSLIEKYGGQSLDDLGPASRGSVAREVSLALEEIEDPLVRVEFEKQAAFRLRMNSDRFIVPKSDPSQAPVREQDPSMPNPGRRPTTLLPRIDREILNCAMVKKDTIPSQIMHDPNIIEGLQPETLAFIEELSSFMTLDLPVEEKRAQIKSLLESFGPSWTLHWRKAHELAEDNGSDIEKSFEWCRQTLRRTLIKRLIREKEEEAQREESPEIREPIFQEILTLQKSLQGLVGK